MATLIWYLAYPGISFILILVDIQKLGLLYASLKKSIAIVIFKLVSVVIAQEYFKSDRI